MILGWKGICKGVYISPTGDTGVGAETLPSIGRAGLEKGLWYRGLPMIDDTIDDNIWWHYQWHALIILSAILSGDTIGDTVGQTACDIVGATDGDTVGDTEGITWLVIPFGESIWDSIAKFKS